MTTDIKGLMKEARGWHAGHSNDSQRMVWLMNKLCDALEAMAGEVASLQNTFDLMWKADQRAIKLWQEATGKDHIWPDRTKTTVWLLERAEAAEAERDRLKAALERAQFMSQTAHNERLAAINATATEALGGDA